MEQTTKYLQQVETGMYEYMLVAHPVGPINEKIRAIRQRFCHEYQQRPMAETKPQIIIAGFKAWEAMEDTILRYTQRICCQLSSFEVALNNYSGIPPHTIYLRVQDPAPFRELVRQLAVVRNYVDSCSCSPFRLYSKPYLRIADSLPEVIYDKAMVDYAQQSFHETFLLTELVLQRRSSNYDAWKAVHVFRLVPAEMELVKN